MHINNPQKLDSVAMKNKNTKTLSIHKNKLVQLSKRGDNQTPHFLLPNILVHIMHVKGYNFFMQLIHKEQMNKKIKTRKHQQEPKSLAISFPIHPS